MRGRTPALADRLAALREAVEVADGRLEVPELVEARVLLAKAGAREALGDATVVALAGATGSGKSTLFNALSGSEVSTPGVRRPTTGVAHATVWGGDDDPTHPSDRLLDWLQVPRRHRHPPEPALDGLVLLDLPDHDSVKLEHRLEVDRLVQLVDVLVWVLDPEKYADAAVHERYLVPLAGHAGVLLVVLNQVDRLDPAATRACLADLRGLLDREGLADTPLLAVSARTGTGLGELRADLARRVSARRAATDRLTADVRGVATALAAHCAAGPPGHPHGGSGVGGAEREQLADALADAAGVPAVTAAVERSVRRNGTAATGWPLVRWTRKLRPDPLDRLHLGQGAGDDGAVVARTSLPAAGAVQRAGVTRAVRAARASPRRGATSCGGPSRCRRSSWPTGSTGPSPAPTSVRSAPRCGSARWVGCSGCSPWSRWRARCGCWRWWSSASSSSTTSSRCPGWRGCRCPRCCWSAGCWPGRCWRWSPGHWWGCGHAGARGGPSSGCTRRWTSSRRRRSWPRWPRSARTTTATAPPSAARGDRWLRRAETSAERLSGGRGRH
jgi:GTP-binding protein EngB required for normal cell division